MTREEAIFCEKSYIGETNCVDCKYYGTETCQSRESHRMAIKALEQEPTIDYRRAFKIACELLSGFVLYGTDSDKIFETAMQKDGLVSNESYERYILNHLQELDHGQYAGVEE